jgi:hypothetical protein
VIDCINESVVYVFAHPCRSNFITADTQLIWSQRNTVEATCGITYGGVPTETDIIKKV